MQALLKEAFAANGVTQWGVCDFAPLAAHRLPCRAAARLPEHPQSVIVALFPYRFAADDRPRNLSRYAAVNDYHRVVEAALEQVANTLRTAEPAHHFAVFCDNSPIPEVRAAALAGLGAVGENGLLLNPTFGSYVFIGEIVTDCPVPPTGGEVTACAHCGRCRAACPAACVGGDKTGCLSAVTQQKGDLTDAERQRIRAGGLVWGCDTCQEVCPINAEAIIAPHPGFTVYRPWLDEGMIEAADLREQAYGWRGAAPLRRNLKFLYGEEADT